LPCPTCEVPATELDNHTVEYPLRTGKRAQAILVEALSQPTMAKCDAILQRWSLRPIQVSISFDRLHAFHSGLFGHHLWKEFKQRVEDISTNALKLIDTHCFTDGSKYEDISKQNILFVSHNVLTKAASPSGYQLLCLIQPYLEEDMYIGLPVHTEWTLIDGEQAQAEFGARLEEYKATTQNDRQPKNWKFPKAPNTHRHAFDDIRAKGASRNTNTKPNEKMHHPKKVVYQFGTNHRNAAPQLLRIDHNFYVAEHIQHNIDRLD
ncbi:hypothetical protein OH77DRAFT_1384324, partial [Trametes cingulata]